MEIVRKYDFHKNISAICENIMNQAVSYSGFDFYLVKFLKISLLF